MSLADKHEEEALDALQKATETKSPIKAAMSVAYAGVRALLAISARLGETNERLDTVDDRLAEVRKRLAEIRDDAKGGFDE